MGDIGTVTKVANALEGEDNVVDVEAVTSDPNAMEGHQGLPPGVDAKPLLSDYAVGIKLPGSGEWSIIGYIDPKNASVAQNGEVRFYARDPETGDPVVAVHLKSDGTIEFGGDEDNAVRFLPLNSGIEALKAEIKENHAAIALAIGALGGSYTVVPLEATIDAAKIEEIKVS